METWRIWVMVVVFLHRLCLPALVVSQATVGSVSLPPITAGEILIQSDHDGAFLQRTTADIAGTHWLWRSEGSILLYEETAVAGGYIEERRTVGSPVEDLTHGVGCQVGPLRLGPISFSGIYHRLLDPSAGGTAWSALTDTNRFRLDRSLEPSRWRGVGFVGSLPMSLVGGEISPGVVWSAHEETEIATAVLSLSWPSVTVTWSGAKGTFLVGEDDSWLYEAPPFRADGVSQLGSSVAVRPTIADLPLKLGAEGWQQRVGYRPFRHSVQAFARAPGEVLAITARISRTESGFRALTGQRPRSAEYSGLSLYQGRRVRPWIWRAAWDRRAGWEDDLPGSGVDTFSATFGLGWTHGVTRLLRLQGTTDSQGKVSLNYRGRGALGPVGLLAYARHIWGHPTEEDQFSATFRLSLRTEMGRRRRRFSAAAGWEVAAKRQQWHHGVTMNTSVPMGASLRLELSAELPLVPAPTATTTEWMIRLRSSVTTTTRE